jgi:hypothetical protein
MNITKNLEEISKKVKHIDKLKNFERFFWLYYADNLVHLILKFIIALPLLAIYHVSYYLFEKISVLFRSDFFLDWNINFDCVFKPNKYRKLLIETIKKMENDR